MYLILFRVFMFFENENLPWNIEMKFYNEMGFNVNNE